MRRQTVTLNWGQALPLAQGVHFDAGLELCAGTDKGRHGPVLAFLPEDCQSRALTCISQTRTIMTIRTIDQ